MANIAFSKHAQDVMRERNIPEEWVHRAVDMPDLIEHPADGTTHYLKTIPEHGGRYLRVVVNPGVAPARAVTVFFDRRLGRHS
jgi:Domain of unknown function (DUF4258)